jgi:hypothetical protein
MLEYLEEHINELKDDEDEWDVQIELEQKIVDYFKEWIDWDAII